MVGISLFAGANSAKGFYSFYRFLNRDDYQKVFILKGSPGTGKSTLLRELARQVETRHPVDRYSFVRQMKTPWTESSSTG